MTYSRGPAPAGALLSEGTALLEASGVSEAGLNCGWLLARVLGRDRLSLLADSGLMATAREVGEFKKLLARKASGVPLAYIIGSQPFCGLSLKVDARVLVPRPETEELVGLVSDFLERLAKRGAPRRRALDFGTGSGAIALAISYRFPEVAVTAADRSREALSCAGENARSLRLNDRIKFVRASSVENCGGPFDVLVSNPPYIPTGVIPGLDREVRAEPRLALDGGADGLAVASRIIERGPEALKRGGALFMEIGDVQASAVLGMLDRKVWKDGDVARDLNGKRRFLRAIRR